MHAHCENFSARILSCGERREQNQRDKRRENAGDQVKHAQHYRRTFADFVGFYAFWAARWIIHGVVSGAEAHGRVRVEMNVRYGRLE